MNRMGNWMLGMLATSATTVAQADSQLGPVLGSTMLADEPQSGALAVVGVGLLVLSAFAKRRRDP